jgi:hypothetical protein
MNLLIRVTVVGGKPQFSDEIPRPLQRPVAESNDGSSKISSCSAVIVKHAQAVNDADTSIVVRPPSRVLNRLARVLEDDLFEIRPVFE